MEDETTAVSPEPQSYESVDESIGDPYCFESDHVALRDNSDYHKLLRTICNLEAQRSQAIEDLELLYEAQEKVLEHPIGFVHRLQITGNLGIKLPGRQNIAELPAINWEKYTSSVDFTSFGTHRQSARLKRQGSDSPDDENLQRLKSRLVVGTESDTITEGFVRGRFKDESKSSTFNKLWTPEEQKRLDELLVKYPPEEVEARRWRKIATDFGDRTPQQVASRVQKYFEKLEKNKLPIPGRVPKLIPSRVKRIPYRHLHHNWAYRDSTFLQMYKPPVMMKEDGDEATTEVPSVPPTNESFMNPAREKDEGTRLQDSSDDEDVPEELMHTAEYKELMQLKALRHEKLQTLDASNPQHHGFKCDKCGCSPIVGIRWHCVDCPSSTSLDFCETCFDNLGSFETACHNSSHRVRPVKRTWNKPTQDQDYMNFSNTGASSNYNYLDPNYMPAV